MGRELEHRSGRLVLSDPESVAPFADKVKRKFVVDYLRHLVVLEFKGKREQKKRHLRLII